MDHEGSLVFSRAEYEGRLAAVRCEMAVRGVDVLLVHETEHLAYLVGWHASGSRYHVCLVPMDGDGDELDDGGRHRSGWMRSWDNHRLSPAHGSAPA